MIRDVILPQLAMGMSEGGIVEWAVPEGALVARDQNLVSIETEKVITELPAPYAGYVHLVARPGDTLPVETVIARIAETEAEYQSILSGAEDGRGASLVAASDRAAEGKVEQKEPRQAEDAPTASATRRIRASGLAKAVARKNGVDLSGVVGSGPGGRIVRADVLAAIERSKDPRSAVARAAKVHEGGMREKARIPVTGLRGAIAAKMLATKTTAAQTYCFCEIDITRLQEARNTINAHGEESGTRVSLLAFYARAIALACRDVPICNATLKDDEIILWDSVNVGIAVALPGRGAYDSGLIVPVVRDVDRKGLLEINSDIKDLAKRARASELAANELQGGTITISSTDGFLPGGWMISTPLLNLPQVVNFQPSTPVEKVVVIDGEIAVRTILPCGLTFDHRAMDGAPIGKFMMKMRDLLANPELMLL